MSTTTLTLTEFLLARIAEDEAEAYATGTPGERAERLGIYGDRVKGEVVLGPTRARAEVEAKLRIVGELRDHVTDKRDPLDVAVYHLAAVYADHPDYRDEWRP